MFHLRKAILNIRRHWTRSFLAVFTCMLIVVFLFLFFSGLLVNLSELEALPAAIPIEARLTNLNGSQRSEVLIKESYIQALEASEYVTDLDYTAEIAAVIEQRNMELPWGLGVNRVEAMPGVPKEAFVFESGKGIEAFAGTEPVCVMEERELESLGLRVGDTVQMTLFNTTYPGNNPLKSYNRLGLYDVRVIGSFSVPSGGEAAESRTVQVVFPVGWLREIHAQVGSFFFADSARFRVAKPLELNAFKTEMHAAGLLPVISEATSTQTGGSLLVNDETFVKTATRLKENITLTQLLLPFVVLIVGFLGFVVSYLLLQSRKPEIAIMRSLGVSRKNCFGMLLFESAVLEMSGSLAGVAVASILVDMNAMLAVGVILPFFVVYMAGTAIALAMLGRFSVMQVLTALD